MLRELSIRNLAVVEAVDLSLSTGLHVLTGETGAGKSILIDAISLVLGARGSAEFVRHQANKAEISALFDPGKDHPVWQVIDDFGLDVDNDDSLLLKRDISHRGKSTCRVNGNMVTLTMLKKIGSQLMDIHGQHDQQSLLREEEQIEWLDAFAGDALNTVKEQYRRLYDEYRKVEATIQRLTDSERQTAQRIDLLEFQVNEIAAASLVAGEEEQLQQQRDKLAHMEKILQHVQSAYTALQPDQQTMNDLSEALTNVEAAAEYAPELNETLELIRNAYYQLEEAAAILRRTAEEQEFDQQQLNEIETRLYLIEQLKRKYAPTVQDILHYAEETARELEVLKNRESHLGQLAERRDELHAELRQKAETMTTLRKQAAQLLQEGIERELQQLHMKDCKFYVRFESADNDTTRPFFSNGWDRLKFFISTNPGEPPKPLANVASGGELSRIMLALKTLFQNIDEAG